MEAERWKRVEELFHAALEREPRTASAFLQQACGDDLELLREVESLLGASRQTLGFAHSAIANIAREQSAGLSSVGERVGAYVLGKKLGEGGMGTVYLGIRADGKDQQQVAIKLIQPWVRLSPRTLRRFTTEQAILVNLKHPNITRLLDAGITDDNSPYFAMEYVDGKPIDDYCSKTRLLTNDRLRLFLIVCAAVKHAHKNHVIHRDIKPANILVTAEGTPKLLDFGIAKLLDPIVKEQTLTRLSQRMMTLEYASPEQLYGGKITAATDVYALGVLLYELLTGHHPFRLKGKGPLEIVQIICDQQAEAPSQTIDAAADRSPGDAANRLHGDLDHIVLMAMDKQPLHRYPSVDALSRDVMAYLNEYPLHTRTYTPAHRVEKFVRRHGRAAIVAALLMILALLALAIGIAMSNKRVNRKVGMSTLRSVQIAQKTNSAARTGKSFHPGHSRAGELLLRRDRRHPDQQALLSEEDTLVATGEAGGTIDNIPWRTPAAWEAVFCGNLVLEWRVFADKQVHEILARKSSHSGDARCVLRSTESTE